eukprot:gnl/Trimastix_PCT/2283.p1 GENE.gnl/Trimastix_PCT/2283~~gnl/Trimastix_PCT/2283.p1  ORF type:complete len:196 (-),score=28.70 gnl/Trimastix_PCT/2283:129-716(-)
MMNDEPFEVRRIEPRGRESRRTYKEHIEKSRLGQRREKVSHYDPIENPVTPSSHAPMYQGEVERFETDSAAFERRRMDQVRQRQKRIDQSHRDRDMQRESERWKRMEESDQREQQRIERLAGTGKKNVSSVAYDPVTLSYNDSHDGERLRREDEMRSYHARLRTENLERQVSREGINPITGEPVRVHRATAPSWM